MSPPHHTSARVKAAVPLFEALAEIGDAQVGVRLLHSCAGDSEGVACNDAIVQEKEVKAGHAAEFLGQRLERGREEERPERVPLLHPARKLHSDGGPELEG